MSQPNKPQERFVVVIGADSSPSSEHVVEVAARMAKSVANGELHIVHVLANDFQPAPLAEIPNPWSGTQILERGREQLQHLGRLANTDLKGRVVGHLATGEPWREILQFAENLRADLIVVGTHNFKGIKRLALGSVSEHVARKAKCPVLVVRPKEYANRDIPEIEPACADCIAKQRETNGASLWCDRHSVHHPKGRTYYETPESFAVGSSLLRP